MKARIVNGWTAFFQHEPRGVRVRAVAVRAVVVRAVVVLGSSGHGMVHAGHVLASHRAMVLDKDIVAQSQCTSFLA
jgi:hypothetical protein